MPDTERKCTIRRSFSWKWNGTLYTVWIIQNFLIFHKGESSETFTGKIAGFFLYNRMKKKRIHSTGTGYL